MIIFVFEYCFDSSVQYTDAHTYCLISWFLSPANPASVLLVPDVLLQTFSTFCVGAVSYEVKKSTHWILCENVLFDAPEDRVPCWRVWMFLKLHRFVDTIERTLERQSKGLLPNYDQYCIQSHGYPSTPRSSTRQLARRLSSSGQIS